MKPEWYKICESPILRKRFRELACSFTRNTELQKELYQEAWLAVCGYLSNIKIPVMFFGGSEIRRPDVDTFLGRDQKSIEYYEKLGYRAMNRLRMKERRHQELFKPWTSTAAYQRVRRRFIKRKREDEKK